MQIDPGISWVLGPDLSDHFAATVWRSWWHKQTFTITDTGWTCLFGPCYKGMPCYSRTTAAFFGKSLLLKGSQSTRGSLRLMLGEKYGRAKAGWRQVAIWTAGTAQWSFLASWNWHWGFEDGCGLCFDNGANSSVILYWYPLSLQGFQS